jgi:membrane protease YdiL (CAAX protease family)
MWWISWSPVQAIECWLALEKVLKDVLAIILCIVYSSVLFGFLHVGDPIISVTVYL